MKHILILALMATIMSCSNSKIKNSDSTTTAADSAVTTRQYPLAVSFNSICCGTASPDFLKTFVRNFNEKNSYNIAADIAAGCGREGEFDILFKMPANESLNKKFASELSALVIATDSKNKKTNSSSGGIQVVENVQTADYSHCRLGIAAWPLK